MAAMVRLDAEELEAKSAEHRRSLVTITRATGGAYLAQALSCIDLMTALLYRFVSSRPHEPGWAERDRFLLSPGHYALPLYVCLADLGFFERELLGTFKQDGSPVELATHRGTLPGVEFSGGSLGQALSVGVGRALAARLRDDTWNVFVMMSDGEQASGQVWEAATAASHYRLDNLVAIIDANGYQVDGRTTDVMDTEPLSERYTKLGWVVEEVNGNDMQSVVESLESLLETPSRRPRLLLGRTVRGKGVEFMEGNPDYHYTRLDDDLEEEAMRNLHGAWDEA